MSRLASSKNYFIVLVTAPNLKTARHLAHSALAARLVACANLVPRIESHYWWQGKIESGKEVLILFKTARARLAQLERLILSEHPYQTPEFLVCPIAAGTKAYLGWLEESLRPVARGAPRVGGAKNSRPTTDKPR